MSRATPRIRDVIRTPSAPTGGGRGWPSRHLPGRRDYLATPLPGPRTGVADLRLLAVDIETTGLDPSTDHILSVGFVPLDGLVIDLSGATHLLCRADAEVGQSAVVHGITDDALPKASSCPRSSSEWPRPSRPGPAVHHAAIETQFLSAASQATHGVPFPVEVVDTMELQARVLRSHTGADLPPGALRLPTARAHLGLPRYRRSRGPHRRSRLCRAVPRPGRPVERRAGHGAEGAQR